MARDRVEQGWAGQAQDGSDEEEEEDELVGHVDVLVAVVAERLDVEDDGGHEEGEEADEMRPDVARLGVDAEDGLEAGREGGQLGPVPEVEVVVVPGWESRHPTKDSLIGVVDVEVHYTWNS